MKLGFLLAMILAGGLTSAQNGQTKTRLIVEEGKDVTLTGCIQRTPDGEYTLTHAAGKDGSSASYILALLDDDDDDELQDLREHVGHRVEIQGKAADRGDGKIRVRTESETRNTDGKKGKTETKSEVKGDLSGLPFLGVKTSRMIASVCP
jgi:hypothetical protein